MTVMLRRFVPVLAGIAFVVFLWLFHPLDTLAATLKVNSTADPGAVGDTILTLREAINVVNSGLITGLSGAELAQIDTTNPLGTNDTIVFDATVFPSGTAKTITLSNAPSAGTLTILGTVIIDGRQHNVIVDGNNAVTVFALAESAGTFFNLTIQHGNALGDNGGGILNGGGSLTVTACTFIGNRANDGGAIVNNGVMDITGSTFTGNNSTTAGIAKAKATGRKSGDNFTQSGGAIANFGSGNISNSTFFGNTAAAVGGAILDEGGVSLTSVTISGNTAPQGGGLFVSAPPPSLLTNTLIAGNTLPGNVGTGPDVAGSLDAASANNLIGNGDGSFGLTNGTNGNQIGTTASPISPLLGTLGNYGGVTQTLPLLPNSPAINAGTATGPAFNPVPGTDQRGKNRAGAPDIGAFESQGFTLSITSGSMQSAPINSGFPNPLVVTVTANNPGDPVGSGPVTFTVNPSTAAVGASATITGSPVPIGANGTAQVTATADGIVGTYTVTPSAPGVTTTGVFTLANTTAIVRIVVTYKGSTTPTMKVGEIGPFIATAVYSDNSTADVTGLVVWSGNKDVTAAVDTIGKVTAWSPGTVTITATQGAVSGQAVTTVTPGTPMSVSPASNPAGRPAGTTGQPTTPPGGAKPNPAPPSR
jgi:hypothetical protein